LSTAFTLERRIGALDDLLERTAEAFARERIAPELRQTVDFVLEELFTNVVKYGRQSAAGVRVEVTRIGEGVEVTLVDEDAERFDPTQGPEVDIHRPIEERVPGGLGLHLIRKLVDSIEYRYLDDRRESRVTFRKTLAKTVEKGEEKNARD
jgi:anti-sigma regulatory factor (Ser/Thr protein kinase)